MQGRGEMSELTHDNAHQAFRILRSRASRYALIGTGIAVAAVVIATLLVSHQVYGGITLDNIMRAHRENVAIWALNVMPFLFGFWGQFASVRMARAAGHMVDTSTDDLRRELEEARFTAQAKTDFFARMSHELRTPLNAIIGMSDLLAEDRDTRRRREHARIINESAQGLLTLINDVLDFSRIEAGRLELDDVEFDLIEHIKGIATLMRGQADEKGLRLICLIPRNAPRHVRTDPGRLRQILVNLIGNAIKFTDEGEVVVSLHDWKQLPNGGYRLHVRVADTGSGISPEDQRQLFEAYRQVGERSRGGTGLGLSITREIVRAMNGTIHLDSEPGQGSVFSFTAEVGDATPRAELPEVRLQRRRILLADADVSAREVLAGQLRALGLEVHTAGDGVDAMQQALRAAVDGRPFEVMLADMFLPHLSGEALGRRLKEKPETRDICMGMLTTAGARGDAKRLKELGFVAYLTRPLPPEHLQHLLQRMLGAGEAVKRGGAPDHIITRFDLPATTANGDMVLVADDSEVNREIALHQLQRLGIRAEAVTSGREAVQAVRQRDYAAVLMDFHMPDLPGDQAISRLRELDGPRGQVPAFVVTAGLSDAEADQCRAAGASDILIKPFDTHTIHQALGKYIPLPEISTTGDDDSTPITAVNARNPADPELARIFLKEAENRIAAIRWTLAGEQADLAIVSRNAHALKSASRHFAADTLSESASRLEHVAYSEDAAAVRSAFSAVEAAWRDTEPMLRESAGQPSQG